MSRVEQPQVNTADVAAVLDGREPENQTRSLRPLLASTAATFAGYAFLASVVPLWASAKGAGEFGAGSTTGVFMAATVATQLIMPWLLRRLGYRATLIAGSVLLGAPALFYAVSTSAWALLVISAVRGLGFGLLTVSGVALAAELAPVGGRGRATGRYGVAAALPQLGCLPASVWIAQHVSYSVVFVVAGVLPLVATLPLLAITDPVARRVRADVAPVSAGTALTRLVAPSLVLLAITFGIGAMVTFLPITGGEVAPTALFALNGGTVVGRWVGGALGDLFSSAARLLMTGIAVVGCGLFATALGVHVHGSWSTVGAMVLGAVLCGVGFGVVQNETLVVMYDRAGRTGYGLASTVWNIGFDGGAGLGAVVVGALLAWTGAPAGFALAGLLAFAALPAALAITRSSVAAGAPSRTARRTRARLPRAGADDSAPGPR